MKLRTKIVIHLITVGVILSSCSTTQNNSSSPELTKAANNRINIGQYLNYQGFNTAVINGLDEESSYHGLSREDKEEARKLRNNVNKILAKKSFVINLDTANIYSVRVMESIYQLDLPIKIEWGNEEQSIKFVDLMTKPVTGFCSSLYKDAMDSISTEVVNSDQETIIIFMKNYAVIANQLTELLPEIKSIQFDSSDPQNFAAMLLGINDSQNRFVKIKNLNPNQELKFSPRPRDDIQKIVLILEPTQYKSLLPALRYHGGSNFKYINFISSLENLQDVNQLLDFENTLMPLSENIIKKIKTKEIDSLESITRNSILNDWLLIELMNQSGVRSANISGMTGAIEFKKGRCAKRRIPLSRVSAQLIAP